MPIARVEVGIADVRGEPRAEAELVDQLRYGERVTLLAERDDWLFVQAREDHYFGWIEESRVRETDDLPGDAVVTVALAPAMAGAQGPAADLLPAGTWLDLGAEKDGSIRVAHPWVERWVRATHVTRARDLPARPPRTDDILAAARAFLDVPYLWGGTSARGLDCSGFVQLAYRLCGVLLARDADQQATQGRRAEDAARPGDLLFFGTPVTHVGLALDESRMIHAAGDPIGRVVEQEVRARGRPVSIRRFLP